MESTSSPLRAPDDRKFQVSCKADPTGILAAAAKTVVVTVGQRVRREHQEEMWDSVSVSDGEHPNGDLMIKVLVFNPDWDEPVVRQNSARPLNLGRVTMLQSTLHAIHFKHVLKFWRTTRNENETEMHGRSGAG
jgi:hypothetical protein